MTPYIGCRVCTVSVSGVSNGGGQIKLGSFVTFHAAVVQEHTLANAAYLQKRAAMSLHRLLEWLAAFGATLLFF